jgi:hypothetical protein
MSGAFVNTIEELEMLYYSDLGLQYLREALPGDLTANFVAKSSGPISTSTSGVYNAVYGAQAWSQLNQEANTFGCLAKVPWGRSGFRVKKARANSLPTAGVTETGALPDPYVPDYAEISYKPKIAAMVFNNTEMQEYLVEEADDDNYASMAQLRLDMAVEHKEDINKQLNTEFGTLAGNMFESVDRVTASSVEQAACGEHAGDEDLYGVDRSANTYFNAQVSHNSNVDRTLTDSVIRTMIETTIPQAGGNTQFGQTGHDTMAVVTGLYQSQVRYNPLGQAFISASVNGIQSKEGIGAGVRVVTIYGIPMVISKDTVKDTLSRMYFLDNSNPEGFDTPRLCLKVAKPTQYFEAGINQGTPFAINAFGNKGLYRTMGELHCPFPAAQGKIRDLK